MTAESLSSHESTSKPELRLVKINEEFARRSTASVVIPPVLEWGPAKNRLDDEIQQVDNPESFEDRPRSEDN